MTPTVSVVIPTYNSAHFLLKAVSSVQAQQWPTLEIIVVDDGSTDDTPAVLRKLSQKEGVRCIRQENAGPAAARNRGIRESRGEWIAFLDDDDYWFPRKLEKQFRALAEQDGDFAYCGVIVVDDDNQTVSTLPAVARESLLNDLVWGNLLSTPTVIVRRSLFDQTGLFDEMLRTGEDWDLWLRLAANGRGVCVSEPLVAVHHSQRNPKQYHLSLHEAAITRIFSRFFASLRGRDDLAAIASQRRKILSSHFSMLAKAHLKQRNVPSFFRYAIRSIASSPRGVRYLLPGSINERDL